MHISKKSYYRYLSGKLTPREAYKKAILARITSIYHQYKGILGYRMMHNLLIREGFRTSLSTIHKYMNQELKLFSITRKKRFKYTKTGKYRVYENTLNQEFHAKKPNQKWCIDFTYLPAINKQQQYNCTIIDL